MSTFVRRHAQPKPLSVEDEQRHCTRDAIDKLMFANRQTRRWSPIFFNDQCAICGCVRLCTGRYLTEVSTGVSSQFEGYVITDVSLQPALYVVLGSIVITLKNKDGATHKFVWTATDILGDDKLWRSIRLQHLLPVFLAAGDKRDKTSSITRFAQDIFYERLLWTAVISFLG